MIQVDDIITRLETLVSDGTLGFAGGAGALSTTPEATLNSKSAFAMPPSMIGGEQKLATGATLQKLTVSFGIAVVFLGIGADGSDATAEVQTVSDAIVDLFFGWTPDASTFTPCVLAAAGIEEVDTEKGYLIYSFTFQTTTNMRKVAI